MEMALNKESKRKTPSVISFRNNERLFGEDAQNMGVRFPANSYGYLFDLLGKTIDSPIVELYKKRFPYYEIIGDKTRNTVIFRNGEDTFSIEELISQLLTQAKADAQTFTGQPITECVITVPGFFGQAERTALLTAANLSNLKVLQFMNDYTAVALNYGVFRRQEMNETVQYFLFYDMGAYKTSAAVISYQLVKDKATREINPVVQVLGVGYDRTLGGLEMQLRLRDHLAKVFNGLKKTKTDVFTNPRAMAKLFKEAGRVKNVLSANTEIYAQIEGLLDEKDFRHLVTRDEFEAMCDDLFKRAPSVLERALKTAGLSLDVITQVILFGGATRVPKVQDVLKVTINQELGRNLNADEAATMGAAYRAADLATGFKVKKYIVKDAVLFPLQVVFEREGDTSATKQVRRTLFGPMNPFPQKKVITFNKHTKDFSFDVNYADLEHLSQEEISRIGSLNLTKISLTKVASILDNNKGDNIESKGIKAHFTLDDSGIFTLSNVELVLDKTVVAEEDESPLSMLGSTISKLFSSDKKEDEEVKESEDKKDEEEPAKNETNSAENATNTEENAASANKTDKPKVVVVKETIPSQVKVLFTYGLSEEEWETSRKKIFDFDEKDRLRTLRETALNALESYVIDAQMKVDLHEYKICAKEDEIAAIKKSSAEISEWLYEDGSDADYETYERKMIDFKKLTNDVWARHWEHQERPEALKALNSMVNGSQHFLTTAKNLTKEVNPEKDVFTEIEIKTLDKAITETIEWRDKEIKAQKKLAKNDAVRLTVKSLTDKMALLDREVKYLVNKLKYWRPKVKETPKEKKNETIEGEEDKKDDLPNEDFPTEDQEEKTPEDEEVIMPTETTDEQTPRTEL